MTKRRPKRGAAVVSRVASIDAKLPNEATKYPKTKDFRFWLQATSPSSWRIAVLSRSSGRSESLNLNLVSRVSKVQEQTHFEGFDPARAPGLRLHKRSQSHE